MKHSTIDVMGTNWNKWIKDNGIVLNNCRAGPTAHGNGLIFTTDRQRGAQSVAVVTIPKAMIVEASTVIDYSNDHPLLNQMLHLDDHGNFTEEIELTAKKIIARFLLYQIISIRRGNSDEKYATWIRSLPPSRDMNLPFAWPEEEMSTALQGTSIADAALAKLHFLKISYQGLFSNQDLRSQIESYVKSGPNNEGKTDLDYEVSFNDWMLVEQWIASRSLSLPVENEESELVMVPVLDLCNHSSVNNAFYETTADGHIRLFCNERFKGDEGEELTINYGHSNAGEFLFNYGFIPENFHTAGEAVYFYDIFDVDFRRCLDPEFNPNETNKTEADRSYEILAQFYERPKGTIKFKDDPNSDELWLDDFISLHCCGDAVELVRNVQSGYYELHFRGEELDLENIQLCIKQRDPDYYRNTVLPRGNAAVIAVINAMYLKDQDVEQRHKLLTLEKKLLHRVVEGAKLNTLID